MKKAFAAVLALAIMLAAVPVMPYDTVFAGFIIEEDAQTAMEKNRDSILAGLEKTEITNDLTKDEFESIIISFCNYSTDKSYGAAFEIYDFKLTPATQTKAGLVKAVIVLSQEDGEVDFTVKKEIPALSGPNTGNNNTEAVSLQDIQTAVSAEFAKLTATNAYTHKEVMDAADYALAGTGAEFVIDEFLLTKSTSEESGSLAIKYTITLDDGKSGSFDYKWQIEKLKSSEPKKEIEAAKSAINAAIWEFDVSNSTTKNDILNMAKNALPVGSNVKVTLADSDFSIVKATTAVEGTVSARLVLTCDDIVMSCAVGKTIQRVVTADSKKIEEDWSAASSAIGAQTYTNKSTKEDILQIARTAAKNGSAVEIGDNFVKIRATFKDKGKFTGYLKFTLNDETKELWVNEEIPMLVRNYPGDRMSVSATEWDILRITNIERVKAGQLPLAMLASLQNACDIRENEVYEKFSHTRPDGTSCFTALEGISYSHSGENIAKQTSASNIRFLEVDSERMMESWMNSDGHRANILKSSYTHMGVGVHDDYGMGVGVQMFVGMLGLRGIANVTTSAGKMNFEDIDEMEKNYMICTYEDGSVAYLPLDAQSMEKTENGYRLHIAGSDPIDITVEKDIEDESKPPVSNIGNFDDVKSDAYYADAVKWAVEKKITAGTSDTTFSPDDTCTRAQILTFLWRAVGSPKADTQNPFSDVSADDYYYDAAIWASEKGMVSSDKFEGNMPCTRSSTVTYIWKNAGCPPASVLGTFRDVDTGANYAGAVAWAVASGVTSGTSSAEFSPDMICSRGQIVTFLNRALK